MEPLFISALYWYLLEPMCIHWLHCNEPGVLNKYTAYSKCRSNNKTTLLLPKPHMGDTKTHTDFCILAKLATVNLHVQDWDANSVEMLSSLYYSPSLCPDIMSYKEASCVHHSSTLWEWISVIQFFNWQTFIETAYYVSGARHITMNKINSLCSKHLKAKELLHLESKKLNIVPES